MLSIPDTDWNPPGRTPPYDAILTTHERRDANEQAEQRESDTDHPPQGLHLTPQGLHLAPEFTADGLDLTPDGLDLTPDLTPQGLDLTPDGLDLTPDGLDLTPDLTPQGLDLTPDGLDLTPDLAPQGLEHPDQDIEAGVKSLLGRPDRRYDVLTGLVPDFLRGIVRQSRFDTSNYERTEHCTRGPLPGLRLGRCLWHPDCRLVESALV